MGDGTTTNVYAYKKIDAPVKFKSIRGGREHAIAIDENDDLWGVGWDYQGQLALPAHMAYKTITKIDIGGKKVKEISAGGFNSMILTTNGEAYTFGSRRFNGIERDDSSVLFRVGGETLFKSISCLEADALAIDIDGNLWTAGENFRGIAGEGSFTENYEFRKIDCRIKFKTLATTSAYGSSIIALGENGKLYGWGFNKHQITDMEVKKVYSFIPEVEYSLIKGGYYSTMILDSSGDLWVAGANFHGQLSDGKSTFATKLLTKVQSEVKFKYFDMFWDQTLAIDTLGNVWGCGSNDCGQVGNGITSSSEEKLVQVTSGTEFTKVVTESDMSMALDVSGNIWTWGYNYYGQLGDGTKENKTIPQKIDMGETKFKDIAIDGELSIALDVNGDIWASGRNPYIKIDNQFIKTTTYIKIIKDMNVKKVFGTKLANICFLTENDELYMWGYDKEVKIFENVNEAVITEDSRVMVLTNEGKIWAKGKNDEGQLSPYCNVSSSDEFIEVMPGNNFSLMDGGYGHSLAKDENGKIWTWGANDQGQSLHNKVEGISVPTYVKVF